MKTIDALRQRLAELEKEIAAAKKRLPAHSVKPAHMIDLLALEDEHDRVREQIERFEKEGRAD